MSHFSVCRLRWTKEHITELSAVLQSLAPSLEGTFATHKYVTNRYNVTQFMESCIEFNDMAPLVLFLQGMSIWPSVMIMNKTTQNHLSTRRRYRQPSKLLHRHLVSTVVSLR